MITELATAVGLGGSVAAAGSLAMVVWYVWRASAVGSAVASAASTAAVVSMAVAGALALAIALGWLSPRPGIMAEHVWRAGSLVADHATAPLRVIARWLLGVGA
jgi:hypothetical protein